MEEEGQGGGGGGGGEEENGQSHRIREGAAEILFAGPTNAFYNPAQEFNRDLSIAVTRFCVAERAEEAIRLEKELESVAAAAEAATESEGGGEGEKTASSEGLGRKRRRLEDRQQPLRLLEALSASGLRAIRYALEVEGLAPVLANDFSQDAVQLIEANIRSNGVEGKVRANYADAIQVMHAHKVVSERFHIVDLDPYGSPAQFLDAAVQAVADDGILMVTCTDVAVLCGNAPESCFAKYGSVPIRSKACHEAALRIVIRSIEAHANRYARYVQPLLSLSIDFYLRLFLRVNTSPQRVKDSVTKMAWLEQCVGCGSHRLQPIAQRDKKSSKIVPARLANVSATCEHCCQAMEVGGPLWTAPIHDHDWVRRLLAHVKATDEAKRPQTHNRMEGILSLVEEELADVPLFYDYAQLCHHGRLCVPKLSAFRSAILNAGFRVSASHANPCAIKTDAPQSFLWDIIRHLAEVGGKKEESSSSSKKQPTASVTREILSRPMGPIPVDMKLHKDAEPRSRVEGLLRFQDNKGKQHGPKAKAKGSVHSVQAAAYAHPSKQDSPQSPPPVKRPKQS